MDERLTSTNRSHRTSELEVPASSAAVTGLSANQAMPFSGAAIGQQIDRQCPVGLVAEGANIADQGAGLFPDEAAEVRHSPRSRQAEFSTARACARRALARLGGPQVSLPVGRHRAPEWPQDYVGSLSHCADVAVALVAEAARFAGAGIDIETISAVPETLVERIATADERIMLTQLDRDESSIPWGLLLFSAKESVYKCCYQTTGHRISFRDISIRVNADGSLHAWPAGARSASRDGLTSGTEGLWTVAGTHVITAVWQQTDTNDEVEGIRSRAALSPWYCGGSDFSRMPSPSVGFVRSRPSRNDCW
ncbi:4'-phosphopantetheinyl transferase [Brevibacterium sp. HMSC063G07]|uniref:4'-phosphopantetheinyl transferase family protein n=1 Tax=Brevibacterium sp. HMSC063G07 TaxID=1739261 RepID=UPI000AF894F9|nr:4'-phosphopantetheinyl transferase superfamily protein [Brevibacterium sp. HMSC063G07]